jgi:hypothetical protein
LKLDHFLLVELRFLLMSEEYSRYLYVFTDKSVTYLAETRMKKLIRSEDSDLDLVLPVPLGTMGNKLSSSISIGCNEFSFVPYNA